MGRLHRAKRLARWFLQVSGDLRLGGHFSLAGNASGEIVRCEPPRLLAVTWVFGDRPVDEVELRLTPGPDGDTLFELEHATVSDRDEWEGQWYDSIMGVGSGWEPALYALYAHLHRALPDAPAEEWQGEKAPAELEEIVKRSTDAWTALVEASGRAAVTG